MMVMDQNRPDESNIARCCESTTESAERWACCPVNGMSCERVSYRTLLHHVRSPTNQALPEQLCVRDTQSLGKVLPERVTESPETYRMIQPGNGSWPLRRRLITWSHKENRSEFRFTLWARLDAPELAGWPRDWAVA